MSPTPDPVAALRKRSPAEWIQAGDQSLREHLQAQAIVARAKHAPLTFATLDPLLLDPECLRYPTRLVFEVGEMAMHQFAQPDVDFRSAAGDGRVLYLRPLLRDHPDQVVVAVAYMVPVINYGDIITDAHCVLYGAALLGLTEEEFYTQVCALADLVGAEAQFAGEPGGSAGQKQS